MTTFSSSLKSTFNSFLNSFELSCFMKTNEKLTFWRIMFRISYWTSIRRFNWIWIFIKKFFNFDLFDSALRIVHARIFISRIRSLNASCEFLIMISIEEIFWARINRRLTFLLYRINISLHCKNKQITSITKINKFSFFVWRSRHIGAFSS